MIVVDSSVLVAIIKGEDDSEPLLDLLTTADCVVGAPSLVEVRVWCALNLPARSSRWLESFVDSARASVVPFNREMADAASRAFERFGRQSGHSAKLNFGDCMSYAVSAGMQAPLLFKGSDFGRTDVMAHPASIRMA